MWSCNAKEPINKNRPFENIQVNLFDAPAASVGACDLLQPAAATKRTDGEFDLCSQLHLGAPLASFPARIQLAISGETYEERRERRRAVWSGFPIQTATNAKMCLSAICSGFPIQISGKK